MKTIVGSEWPKYLYLQLLCSRDPDPEYSLDTILSDEVEDAPSDAPEPSAHAVQDPDRLSTIHEESEEDEAEEGLYLAVNSEYS